MKGGRDYKGLFLLALLLVVVPVGVWKFALSETYSTRRDISRLKKELAVAAQQDKGGDPVARFAAATEDLLSSGAILEKITPLADKLDLKVIEYTPFVNQEAGGLRMLSAEITLTGDYIPMLRILDLLENRTDECEVRSVCFEKTYNAKERRTVLRSVITVQQLISYR